MANPTTSGLQPSAWVQLPTDSVGKRVGHLIVDVDQGDGTTATVYFPGMVAVDSEGNIIDVQGNADRLDGMMLAILAELREIKFLLNGIQED